MRILALFTVFVAGLSALYFGFIYVVDPYGEYDSGRFPVVVLDSRRAKVQIFQKFKNRGPVDGLVLGSSRSLLLRPEALMGGSSERVFNFAVDNAHAEDFLTIYRYSVALGAAPRFVVLGLDIPSLHPSDVPDPMFERSELRHYLASARTDTAPRASLASAVMQAKSAYTKDHLKDAFRAIVMKTTGRTPKTRFAANGYEQQYSGVQMPAGDMDTGRDFSEDVRSYIQRLDGMRELSPKRLGYLRDLFAEARQHNTTVIVWLTPIHPRLHALMIDTTNYADLLRQIHTQARTWVAGYGIRYKDYSDMFAFSGVENAWNDSTHMDWRNMDRVAGALGVEVRHGL